MRDMVSAVAVGHIDGNIVIDLDGEEEHYEGEVADIPIAVIPSTGEITLLQMDGVTDAKLLVKAIKKGIDTIEQITRVQREALVERFNKNIKGIEDTKKEFKNKISPREEV